MHKYFLLASSKVVLLHAKQAQRGGRCIALDMVDPSTTRESVVSATPWLLYPQQRDPVPIFQEAGWTSEQICMGPENLATSGVQTPNHPACIK